MDEPFAVKNSVIVYCNKILFGIGISVVVEFSFSYKSLPTILFLNLNLTVLPTAPKMALTDDPTGPRAKSITLILFCFMLAGFVID